MSLFTVNYFGPSMKNLSIYPLNGHVKDHVTIFLKVFLSNNPFLNEFFMEWPKLFMMGMNE